MWEIIQQKIFCTASCHVYCVVISTNFDFKNLEVIFCRITKDIASLELGTPYLVEREREREREIKPEQDEMHYVKVTKSEFKSEGLQSSLASLAFKQLLSEGSHERGLKGA